MKKIITWGQELGLEECPYAKRWILDLHYFSIRMHHFMHSDDPRHLHDHPWWYLTIVIRGGYTDHGENEKIHLRAPAVAFRKSSHAHYVDPDEGGAWTILLTGKHKRIWGFWVKGKFKKAYRYFFDYGHPPCE